jgi:hypothetical protein
VEEVIGMETERSGGDVVDPGREKIAAEKRQSEIKATIPFEWVYK